MQLVRAQNVRETPARRRPRIERLADVAGMSARNLTRVFRQVTGISINEFSTRVRVQLARTLLHNPTLTMDALA